MAACGVRRAACGVRRYRGTLPADVMEALLGAAHALEASEDAFAVVVDQKHALQHRLAQTESNLRAALALGAPDSLTNRSCP
ncbi:hypothetical protein [Burkholderia cenocepacia]|uniref:hypothetical protein n=1 Tax=Burkholderia cenocepacia TaxID=95486 RepID=UPI001FB742CE|nr:hypothetical protein [Burkholderia cenocepacia]